MKSLKKATSDFKKSKRTSMMCIYQDLKASQKEPSSSDMLCVQHVANEASSAL